MTEKIAVVLFNLGGPDKPESIKPFLFNFFTDKNIIRLPKPFRFLLATLIANRRSKREAGTSYGMLGGKSPLLENTRAQADALEKFLNSGKKAAYKVFVSMRYWHPMSPETVMNVKAWQPDRIVLLPLYPQYSTTTTRSSLQAWQKASREVGLDVKTSLCCCYPFNAGFIEASAALIKPLYEDMVKSGTKPRLLFSAHGLPESIIREGDPYQWQCEESAKRIAQALGIKDIDWTICYQSRVGLQKWLGPSTEDELRRAAADKVGVLIYPHAFVNEHVETLVEIEHEYREMADEFGVPAFVRVPTVSVSQGFIQGLAKVVEDFSLRSDIAPDTQERLCPVSFSQCCQQECRI